jgi:hypothetical protein
VQIRTLDRATGPGEQRVGACAGHDHNPGLFDRLAQPVD